MKTKIWIFLCIISFSLFAQDTTGNPDTSLTPDTSTLPDTSANPDTTTTPDTATSDTVSNSEFLDTSSAENAADWMDTTTEFSEPSGFQDDTENVADSTSYQSAADGTDTTVIINQAEPVSNGQYNNNKYRAPGGAIIGVGIGTAFNLAADNPTYQAFLGRMWGAGDYISISLIAEGATDFDESWFVDGGLRFDLYPLPAYTAVSPYIGVGAGIGWGTVTDTDEDALGVNLMGTIGLRLFKDLPVGVTFEANVDWLLNHVVADGNPVILTGRVGIAF